MPLFDSDLAEVQGTLLGDGCISKYWSKRKRRWIYELAFTGSLDEIDYYAKEIQPVIQKYFGVSGRLYHRNDNSTRYHIKSKKVCLFFNSCGVPFGKKSDIAIIPKEIMSNNELAIACVRGIWNTDGSIYLRYRKKYKAHSKIYDYLVMQLKMNSKSIVHQVKEILENNGIKCNRITQEKKAYVLRLTNQKAINRYLEEIGFTNKHHLDRILALKKNK